MDKTETGNEISTPNGFLPALRYALRHLYDSVALRESPLVRMLRLSSSADSASELRQTLTKAIRSLQPEPDMPADTQMWWAYEILFYRYVQRCSQLEVAEQLGMSTRHLSRQERNALQVLADHLRQHPDVRDAHAGQGPPAQEKRQPYPFDDEVAWLANLAPQDTVDLTDVLPSVLDLAQPMARQHGVSLSAQPYPDGALPLAVHPIALRQILLSLLSVAIRQARAKRVSIVVARQGWRAVVEVRCPGSSERADGAAGGGGDVMASLEMARRLAEASGGSLTVDASGISFTATVTLPALEQLPVLVIDDNVNTRHLLQRYVSSTRYRITGAQNVEDGLALAREIAPRIIVLDVMMPDMDGWEALGRLRQHPLTSHVPVIVCTILAEEELALSLGASGFVRKPVSRESFLSALDRQAGPAAPGSG